MFAQVKKSGIAVNATLLFIALIWGVGFVPQRLGMDYMGPYAFNAYRFIFGAITLLPLLMLQRTPVVAFASKITMKSGLLLGLLLFGGASFQQISIQFTQLANVAFITSLYVVIVPLIGFFIGYRYAPITWFGSFMALLGLYFLSGFSGDIYFQGDLLAFIGAVFWAVHLLALVKLVAVDNKVLLAFYQFLFCGLLSALMSWCFETHFWPTGNMGFVWALVNGVVVVGVGYTLQLLVLKYAEPFMAAIIFSLEAVFGAIVGYLIFDEVIGKMGILGVVLMLIGCLLAQVTDKGENRH